VGGGQQTDSTQAESGVPDVQPVFPSTSGGFRHSDRKVSIAAVLLSSPIERLTR